MVGRKRSGLQGERTPRALFRALRVVTAGAGVTVTGVVSGPGSRARAGVLETVLRGVPRAVLSKARVLARKAGPERRL